ncbi:hypothetical protein AB4396_00315 [Vibrio cyclitrophicus]
MKKRLGFLAAIKKYVTKPPETFGNKLIEFLIQCEAQGVHFRFPPNMNEHRLKALIQPLNLSRKDTKVLLKEHILPLSTFKLGPAEFFTAMNHPDQQAFPCQVCDNCAPGLFEYYGYNITDTSWCSQCHERGECLDVALIEYYRKHGIDDETIYRHLPRKRWSSGCDPVTYQSLEGIEKAYQSVFESARKNTDTVK